VIDFRYSLMSPSDFVKFRMVEFDEEAIPVSELNPGSSWVAYVEALDESAAVVASSTAAMQEGGRPTDRQTYALARVAMLSLVDGVREMGHAVDASPRLFRAQLPEQYRA
jgi:hypothetical protein